MTDNDHALPENPAPDAEPQTVEETAGVDDSPPTARPVTTRANVDLHSTPVQHNRPSHTF